MVITGHIRGVSRQSAKAKLKNRHFTGGYRGYRCKIEDFSVLKVSQNMTFCTLIVINPSKMGQNQTSGEFKQIQEILSKIGTEIFKIDEEMTEKNETEDGKSISFKKKPGT